MQKPLIIIGAGRSGTNMLRDVITKIQGLGTWPCDEINYIWRYGNARYPNDEFPAELANQNVVSYIRKQFQKVQEIYRLDTVVEKTCANSLRVDFVNKVLPEAKYIFLIRDGRDVVASSILRWRAPIDLPYIFKKSRYVPLKDIPYYAVQYLITRLYRIFSDEKRLSSWGPKFRGMNVMLRNRSLAEVCAVQWARCVQRAAKSLYSLEPEKYLILKYEEFVFNPAAELQRVADFLSTKINYNQVSFALSSITHNSVGSWKNKIDAETKVSIMPHIKRTLFDYGYISAQ